MDREPRINFEGKEIEFLKPVVTHSLFQQIQKAIEVVHETGMNVAYIKMDLSELCWIRNLLGTDLVSTQFSRENLIEGMKFRENQKNYVRLNRYDENFVINLSSDKDYDYEKGYGDVMSVTEFIDACNSGGLIDYDGHATEIIVNGKIVSDKPFSPSDVEDFEEEFLAFEKEHGKVEVVWYNK
ncbi:hypothetical protein Q7A53_05610 [Halobacillus rhizosphaerae]|uniref:hypothetical protein n=1 Tax=Halobacillus rhizosphaerae TaxID=3064889 RepID=UPI00398AEED8